MSEKLYCVYMHTNKINGKKYVGITSKEPKKRWHGGSGYKNNKHFYQAIQKYGWNSFEHEVVSSGLTAEEAGEMEKFLIKQYKTTDSEYGYNICAGGQLNILPESSYKKISEANRGRKVSDDTKKKREKNPPKANKVICDGIEFVSISECAKYYNVDSKKMRAWLIGTRFVPEEFVDMKLHYKGVECEYEEQYASRKWVYCDGKEFPTAVACAEYFHVPIGTLGSWLRGRYNMPQEYVQKNLHEFKKKLYKSKMISPRANKKN